MTDRRCIPWAVLLSLAALSRGASGGLFEDMARDAAEVNRWPCPYVCQDRAATLAPFPQMIENGWRRQNVIGDYHFSNDSNELTPAGQARVRAILTEAPVAHRTVFVRRGGTTQQTAARVNSVRQYAAKLPLDFPGAMIAETDLTPATYPADWPPKKNAKEPSTTRKFQGWVPEKLYLPPDRASGTTTGQ
jgi:hypothetical protein